MVDLKALIDQGEGISVEFQDCQRSLSRDVYETVCAFLNRHGGNLLLGGNVASNILIHREYMNAFPAKLIIERGQMRAENSNKPHGFGLIDPATFSTFPKNPVIAKFFRQIGRADELGSGVRKLMKYGKSYGGSDPELIEDDIFKTIVKYPESEAGAQSGPESRLESKLAAKIILLVMTNESGKAELAKRLGHKTVSGELHKQIKRMLGRELIEMTVPDRPTSRMQRYRLTDKGRQLLQSMKE